MLAKLIYSLYLDPVGETEAGDAEEQPARDNRFDGNDREEFNIPPGLLIFFIAMPKKTHYLYNPMVICYYRSNASFLASTNSAALIR